MVFVWESASSWIGVSCVPHSAQNLDSEGFSVLQLGQFILTNALPQVGLSIAIWEIEVN
jgi:hypothetical protein